MTAETSTIFLLDVEKKAGVAAELRDAIEPAQVLDWQTHWQPALTVILQRLQAEKVPQEKWPQSFHWNWPAKVAQVQGLIAFRGFSVSCGDITQGLMRVNLNQLAQLAPDKGKPLVYVDYLEVAPWNWPDLKDPPRYKGVGMALVTAAVTLSNDEGFGGRLGLHSLPQADTFYRDTCKMTDLGRDSDHQNLRYFEMTTEQAKAFIGKESDG